MEIQQFLQQNLVPQYINKEKASIYNSPCLETLGAYIHCNYSNEKLKVNDFAISLNMTERTLRRKCKILLNTSPSELINKYRIEVSKIMLKQNKLIGFIAIEIGFPSHSHFSTVFKKHVGMSPKEFKKCPIYESNKSKNT